MANVNGTVEITLIEQEVADASIQALWWRMKERGLQLWGQECKCGWGRRVQSEEGLGASWLASGSAVAGEGGGEGGEGGEAGCSWLSLTLSEVLLLSPGPSAALSPRRQ